MADFPIDLRHLYAAIYPISPYDVLLRQSLIDALEQFEEHDRLALMNVALVGKTEAVADGGYEEVQREFETCLDKLVEEMGEREAVRYGGVRILNGLLRLCRQDAPVDWTFETLSENERGPAARIHQRLITESAKRIFSNRQHWHRELYKRFVADCDWLVCDSGPIVESVSVAYYGEQPLRWH